ncbi:hypothetical protein GCM10028802_03230 [Terrabacter terrigena]
MVSRARTALTAVPLLAAGFVFPACERAVESSAAPPLVVSGQVLSATAAGAVLTDASVESRVAGIPTAGSAVFIKLVPTCTAGANLTFAPASSAVIISRATATDGKLIAVGVCMSSKAVARVVRTDGSTSTVDLRESGVTC